MKSLFTAAALRACALAASAQMVLVADLGDIALLPNQANQTFDFFVRNTGSTDVTLIDAFDFVLQVGNGTSGPKIQNVDLRFGTSVLAPPTFSQAGPIGGSTDWLAGYNVDGDGTHHATLTANNTPTLLARVTFDTTGISASGTTWTASVADSAYLLNILSTPGQIGFSSVTGGTISVVPEPQQYALVAGLGLLALAVGRRCPSLASWRLSRERRA